MPEVERKTPEELVELARGIVTNVYYVAWDDAAFNNSFSMMFMLMGPDIDREWLESIGVVYEEYAKANERSVNGYPFFFSMRVLHKEDRPLLLLEVFRLQVALGIITQDQFDAEILKQEVAEATNQTNEESNV